MKKNIIISSVVSLVLSLSIANAKDTSKVYATVNGTNITLTDLKIAIGDPQKQYESFSKQEKDALLDQVINQKLLLVKAMKSDVVTSKQYNETLALATKKLKNDLALQMWMEKIAISVDVSDAITKDFYDKNKKSFVTPMSFKANHILVATQKEADDIINTLNKSKKVKEDFIALAKTKSTGPSGPAGGDLGWFAPGAMVPTFDKAVSELKIGQYTKSAVKTRFGFHVIYLDDKKKEGFKTYDSVKTQLKQMVGQNAFNSKVEQILKESKANSKIVIK